MPQLSLLTVLPLSATIIAGAFAIVLLNRYFGSRRRPHELMWGIAFVLFAIAAATQVYADVAGGWTPLLARTYYLTGAILNVGFLALGTFYLLVPRRTANIIAGVTIALALVSAFITYTVVADASVLSQGSEVDWHGFFNIDTLPRWLAGLFSGVGSIVVIGGALWSGFVFWRKHIMRNRMIGVFLIAVGTLLVGFGGTVKNLFHNDNYLYTTMAVGVVVMFIGYLQTIRPEPVRKPTLAEPAAEAVIAGGQGSGVGGR